MNVKDIFYFISHHFLRVTVVALLLAWCLVPAMGQTRELGRLRDAAEKAAKRGQWQQADSLYRCYHDLFCADSLTKNYRYTELLGQMVQAAVRLGHVDHALELQRELVEVRRTAPDCIYAQCASAVSDLAGLYALKADYAHAIEAGAEGVEMLEKAFGRKHNFYCIALSNLASYYFARGEVGDAQQAVNMAEYALAYIKKGTREYATLLDALVVYYSQTGQHQKANQIASKARREARKRLKEDGASYATTLNNQSIRLARAGNYEEAVHYAEDAKSIFEKNGTDNTIAYTRTLSNLATFYQHLQRYKEAVALLEKALPIIERNVGNKHPDYVRCASDLSSAYRGTGNLDKAGELAHESERLGRSIDTYNSHKYAKSLSKQAATFASNGNYERAIEQERKALNIFRQRTDSTSMAISLGALATYYSLGGYQLEAFSTSAEALSIFEQRGQRDQSYAQALNAAAILYYNNNKLHEATDYGHRAKAIYDQLNDTTNAIYARIIANVALFTFMADSTLQAIELAKRALRLHSRLLGDDHPDNILQLYNLAVYQSKAGLRDSAETYYLQAMKLLTEQVRTNFLHLTSNERGKFWQQKSYLFKYAPMLAYLDRNNSKMASVAYNSLLFTKGILLNSDIDFRNLLRRSGDEQLLSKYEQMEGLQRQLEAYYRLPSKERDAGFSQVKEQIYQLERDLVRGCKEYGSFTEKLSINAQQIAEALAPDEAAIEFASIDLQGVGTTYLALLLRKGQPAPLLLRLFSEYDLQQLYYPQGDFFAAKTTEVGISSIYNDLRLGHLVWKPIMEHLNGISRIYFSPTDLFYQLGIEYLPCDSTTRMAERYQTYRLSSTKQLVERQPAYNLSSAVVFGGLNYNMNRQQLLSQHQKMLADTNYVAAAEMLATLAQYSPVDTIPLRRTIDSLSLRGSMNYLPGTVAEAKNVTGLLQRCNIPTETYMGVAGTEEAFKALNGRNFSLLHMATHGFSLPEGKAQRKIVLFIDDETDNRDDVLNNSGLLMAGANYALGGGRLPADVDDGVLTASEIAQINLSHTQLVVLSACQTGLGEIRDEGVFGIQRGFKKAGSRSLLMSLWSISDEGTALMMTRFYEQLTAGRRPHEAFLEAQRSMRSHPRFCEPYFWASFVLLDGM